MPYFPPPVHASAVPTVIQSGAVLIIDTDTQVLYKHPVQVLGTVKIDGKLVQL